jgi:hypothetical protein
MPLQWNTPLEHPLCLLIQFASRPNAANQAIARMTSPAKCSIAVVVGTSQRTLRRTERALIVVE